jgi:glycosyltransferase involved in cell wall biosynthesis
MRASTDITELEARFIPHRLQASHDAMRNAALVSVIVPFYNTSAQYMRAAIESVLQQSYPYWEILLVDDGSTDTSTGIARYYTSLYPDRIRYLEHDGHQNRGASAARQLGIQFARGLYIAFLDSDDVWLPNKLEDQVGILDQHPEVGMLYGKTLYWYSWTGTPEDAGRDYMPQLGILPGTPIHPPRMLVCYLNGWAAVPCPSSVLIRRQAIDATGGFEERFQAVIDDQVFFAKLCLTVPILVSTQCWDKYRQHTDSSCAIAVKDGLIRRTYVDYLKWLEIYIGDHRLQYLDVWQALRRQLWQRQPAWTFLPARAQEVERWTKKWILRLEERALPRAFRRWLWTRDIYLL